MKTFDFQQALRILSEADTSFNPFAFMLTLHRSLKSGAITINQSAALTRSLEELCFHLKIDCDLPYCQIFMAPMSFK
jgi:hypothetical protein